MCVHMFFFTNSLELPYITNQFTKNGSLRIYGFFSGYIVTPYITTKHIRALRHSHSNWATSMVQLLRNSSLPATQQKQFKKKQYFVFDISMRYTQKIEIWQNINIQLSRFIFMQTNPSGTP